jgi:hypothetical protein
VNRRAKAAARRAQIFRLFETPRWIIKEEHQGGDDPYSSHTLRLYRERPLPSNGGCSTHWTNERQRGVSDGTALAAEGSTD